MRLLKLDSTGLPLDSSTVQIYELIHGDDLIGLDVVGSLDAIPHAVDCYWCEDLRKRIALRTGNWLQSNIGNK
jgi:hypothetical protein